MPLALRLAGVPELSLGGAPLNTGTRKALALALLLVLDPGQRRSRVADLLWPELDPAQARRNLRRDLFRLRQHGLPVQDGADGTLQLAHVALLWPTPGVHPPQWLDGIDEVAGAELGHWVQFQRESLQRQWVARLAHRARELEAAGQHQAAWQAFSELLADGVAGPDHAEARAALQRLQQHGSTLGVPADDTVDAPLQQPKPLRRTAFVGRAQEQALIAQALRAQRLVILEGSPGVGKTRLALEALAGFGGVLLLRCRPEDAAVPYAGAMRALRTLHEAAPDVTLPAAVRRELAALMPPAASGGPAEAEGGDPARLHRAYHRAFNALAAGNFGAVVIDDWQWADDPSLALWQGEPAAGRTGAARQPLALPSVWVHRTGELPRAALQRRYQWLDSGQALRVQLRPLERGDALALLRSLTGRAAPGAPLGDCALLAVADRSGGNPLFLIETLRHALHSGGQALPASVQEIVVARIRALGPAVRAVLEVASLVGDDTEPALLAAASGLSELAVAQALEHAQAAELVSADARGRHSFAHDLIAQALADSLSPVRRHALHAQLAGALAAQGAEPGRVARQLDLAGRCAEAAPWHLRAGQRAAQRQAWAEALAACDAALAADLAAAPAAAPAAASAGLRLHTRLLRARALARLADVAGAEATLQAAMGDANAVGPESLIDWVLARVELLTQTSRADAALSELATLEQDPALSPAQRRRLLQERGSALSLLGRHAESLPHLQQLLAELPPSALGERQRLLALLGRDAYWAGELGLAAQWVQLGLALAHDLHDALGIASGLYRLGTLERDLGDMPGALAHLHEAAERAGRAGHIELLRSALATQARVMLDQMRLAEAEALIARAEQAAPGWDNPSLEDVFDERRFQLHWLRGEVPAAWAVCRRSIARHKGLNNLHLHLATLMLAVELALMTGDTALARRHLRSAQALSRQAGAGSMHGRELAILQAQLALAQGHGAAALAQAGAWLARRPTGRVEPLARMLITGALAALACGQPRQAGAWLAEAAALPGLSLPQQGLLLAARVRHARTGAGKALAPVLSQARDWLAPAAVPALEAACLRAELAAAGC